MSRFFVSSLFLALSFAGIVSASGPGTGSAGTTDGAGFDLNLSIASSDSDESPDFFGDYTTGTKNYHEKKLKELEELIEKFNGELKQLEDGEESKANIEVANRYDGRTRNKATGYLEFSQDCYHYAPESEPVFIKTTKDEQTRIANAKKILIAHIWKLEQDAENLETLIKSPPSILIPHASPRSIDSPPASPRGSTGQKGKDSKNSWCCSLRKNRTPRVTGRKIVSGNTGQAREEESIIEPSAYYSLMSDCGGNVEQFFEQVTKRRFEAKLANMTPAQRARRAYRLERAKNFARAGMEGATNHIPKQQPKPNSNSDKSAGAKITVDKQSNRQATTKAVMSARARASTIQEQLVAQPNTATNTTTGERSFRRNSNANGRDGRSKLNQLVSTFFGKMLGSKIS